MSLVKKALKKLGVDNVEVFSKWIAAAPKGKHRLLWERYDAELKKWNDEHEILSVWIQKHVDDPVETFNRGYQKQQAKLDRLKLRVQARLARVMVAFKKDMAAR
jgi:hypothetical protein